MVGWYRRGFTLSTFSRAGGSARDTKRLFARCSTANRWRSQQRGLLPTDHNLTYGCYGQRPPLKVNELGGLQQPKKEKKALPRATAGVGERVRLLPSTHTGLRTTGSKIRDSKGGWLPARPRTLFCSFFLFSKLSRKPWRWKPIVKPLDRPDPTTTSRVGGGRGRFFSTPVFRGGRGGAYSESEGEVVVHTVTVRGLQARKRARPARSARERWSSSAAAAHAAGNGQTATRTTKHCLSHARVCLCHRAGHGILTVFPLARNLTGPFLLAFFLFSLSPFLFVLDPDKLLREEAFRRKGCPRGRDRPSSDGQAKTPEEAAAAAASSSGADKPPPPPPPPPLPLPQSGSKGKKGGGRARAAA